MKSHKIKNMAIGIMSVIGLMIVFAAGAMLIAGLLGGAALLASTVPGMHGGEVVTDKAVTTDITKSKSENLLRPDISKQITKIQPAAAPLDTLIREAGAHEITKSLEFKFYSSELRPFLDELDEEFTKGDEAGTFNIKVKSIRIWQKDDDLVFHGVLGNDGMPLVAHIVDKNISASTLEVIFLNGTGNSSTHGVASQPPASIPDDTKIGRLGNAKSELDADTAAFGHLPLDKSNLVQYHMAAVQESIWQKLHAKEVNWDIRDMQNMELYDMRCRMEATSWFGVRKIINDPKRDEVEKYHTAGVIRFIDKHVTLPAGTFTDAFWATTTKNIFVGNNGSDTRYMFIGSDLMERLSQVDHIKKQIDGKSTEFKYGLTWNKIETNFGVLMLRHHEGFNHTGFSGVGAVLDMNHIRKRVFEPMRVRKLDLMTSGISKSNKYVIEETFGLEVRHKDTHALLLPQDFTS